MKYLLFDFDGVLVDSFQLSYDCMLSIDPNPPTPEGYKAFFHGNIYEAEGVIKNNPTNITADVPFFRQYIPGLMDIPPIEHIADTLHRLHGDGSRKMALISSSITQAMRDYLEKHGLGHFFDGIYGADVHKSKVVKIAQALKVFDASPDEAVFITDTLGDIREADKAGLRSIAVSWGFHSIETLQEGKPFAIAKNPQDLQRIIEESS